jgi:hypothetical protein
VVEIELMVVVGGIIVLYDVLQVLNGSIETDAVGEVVSSAPQT